MVLDIKSHKKRLNDEKPEFNLVPFIDILFTILIFIVVTSSFSATSMDDAASDAAGTGKPNITDSSGNAEYYIIPVSGLQTVTVNGQDMSSFIRNNAIAIHANVIDQGEIQIKPQERSIIIIAPAGFDVNRAVQAPS